MLPVASALLLFVADSATAAESGPDAADIARAITEQSKAPVTADRIRRVRCTPFVEEPTEFRCRWRQRSNGRWRTYQMMFAVDGGRCISVDAIRFETA